MGRAAGGRLFGSTSSTSEDKSPELNPPFRKLTLEVKLDLNDEKFRVLLFGSGGGAQIRPHPAVAMALILTVVDN